MATMWALSRAMSCRMCSPRRLSGFAKCGETRPRRSKRSSKTSGPQRSMAKRKLAWVQTRTRSLLSRKAFTASTLLPLSEPAALAQVPARLYLPVREKPEPAQRLVLENWSRWTAPAPRQLPAGALGFPACRGR